MRAKHWGLFLLLGGLWSSSFMWIKLALNEVGPATLVAFRVLLGLIFCATVIYARRIELPRRFRDWYPLLIIGVTNLVVPFLLIAWGEQSVDSSVAAILDSTVPLFTIVLAHFTLSDDRMTTPKILGLLTGFAGVIVLLSKNIGTSPAGVHVHTDSLLGQAAVVLASLFYAGSGVYIRKATQNVHAMVRSAGPLLSASVIMWVSVFATESPVHIPHMGLTWTALLFLGVIGSGFAFILAYYLIHEIGPTRTSMVTYIFPLGGVILGVTFLHEQITWQLIAGGVMIVSSLLIANMKSLKNSAKMKPEISAG